WGYGTVLIIFGGKMEKTADRTDLLKARYIGSLLGGNISIKAYLLGSIDSKLTKACAYYMPETRRFIFIETQDFSVINFRESYDFAEVFNYTIEQLGIDITKGLGFPYMHTIDLTLEELMSGQYKSLQNPYGKQIAYNGELVPSTRTINNAGEYVCE